MKTLTTITILSLLTLQTFGQNLYDVKAQAKSTDIKKDSRSEFAKQFTFVPIDSWTTGMKFIVPKDDNNIGYDLDVLPLKTKNPYSKLKMKDFEFKTFTYTGLEESKGKKYMMFESDGQQYRKELSAYSKDEQVRGFAYLGDVDKAKSQLIGKKLWVLSKLWLRDTNEGPRYQKDGEKFVSVTVTQVGLGDQDAPVRIVFKTDGKDEAYIDAYLSGINKGRITTAKHFDDLFSSTDPRAYFPGISDEIWGLIKKGEVKIGMTSDECKLSWGQPDKINSTIQDGLTVEQWIYVQINDSRKYLYMYNDKLKSMQN